MKILIKVTKEVLERSQYCKSNCDATLTTCAIAEAVREIFPNALIQKTFALLLGSCTNPLLMKSTDYDAALLPNIATDFINLFDRSTPEWRVRLRPFSFEIDVPEFVIQAIGLRQIYKVLSESKTLEHVNPTL